MDVSTKNNYREIYRTYTTAQLLEVLDNEDSYKPEAIAEAQQELASRQLTSEELDSARKLTEQRKRPEFVRIKKLSTLISNSLDFFNPTTPKSPVRIIELIAIAFGFVFVYKVFYDARFFLFMMSELPQWDSGTVIWFLPYVYIPVTLILFFKKYRVGWVMFTIFLVFTVTTTIFLYIDELKLSQGSPEVLALLDVVFPRYGFLHYLILIVLYGGPLYYINTKPIRTIFKIDRVTPFALMILIVVLTTLQWLML